MATQKDTTQETSVEKPGSQPSKDQETVLVPPEEGPEHGYIGKVRADKDRDAYTVAGVTGGTANVADTPKSVQKPPSKS